jgi:hypothetical protein
MPFVQNVNMRVFEILISLPEPAPVTNATPGKFISNQLKCDVKIEKRWQVTSRHQINMQLISVLFITYLPFIFDMSQPLKTSSVFNEKWLTLPAPLLEMCRDPFSDVLANAFHGLELRPIYKP